MEVITTTASVPAEGFRFTALWRLLPAALAAGAFHFCYVTAKSAALDGRNPVMTWQGVLSGGLRALGIEHGWLAIMLGFLIHAGIVIFA